MTLIKLKEKDFIYFYKLLNIPATNFDCGLYCSNNNNPICCDQSKVIPVLYKNEFKYLEKSKMWKKFIPKTKRDYYLYNSCGEDEIMANCQGSLNCIREYRSLICRTFPFYPYIDKNKNFLGLTYNYEFDNKCILISKPYLINKTFIQKSIKLWTIVFSKDINEFYAYQEVSRKIEKNRKKYNKMIEVFTK